MWLYASIVYLTHNFHHHQNSLRLFDIASFVVGSQLNCIEFRCSLTSLAKVEVLVPKNNQIAKNCSNGFKV